MEESPSKRAKSEQMGIDVENVLNKVNNGALSETETLDLATALGKSIQEDILVEGYS